MKTNSCLLVSLLVAAFFTVRAAEIPEKSEIKQMTEETMTSFGEALKQNDFSDFYDEISDLWKKQTTPEKLMESFKSMAGPNFDILGIVQAFKPVFEPAAEINSDGLLIVTGYYPTKPKHLTFRLKYIEEQDEWKLVGINVETKDASTN